MSVLSDLQPALAAIASGIGQAVVAVRPSDNRARGTGVIVDPVGVVVTNAHNVLRGPLRSDGEEPGGVRVRVGEATHEASVTGLDRNLDLAVLTLPPGTYPAVDLAAAADVRLGEPIAAVTRPRRLGLSVSFGTITAVDIDEPGMFEHAAPVPRGGSGGLVTTLDGRAIGINTARQAEVFYLARRVDETLRDTVDRLRRGERTEPARLGIAVSPGWVAARLRRSVGLPEAAGVLVRGVDAEGPAGVAGIQEGDLITALGDRKIEAPGDLHRVLAGTTGSVDVTILRGVEERTVTVNFPA